MNKNGKNLLDKLSELDPELITKADKKPLRKSKIIIGVTSGMATMAAAAVIAVAAAKIAPPQAPLIYDPVDVVSSSGTDTSDTNSSTESPAQSTVSVPPENSDPVSAPVTTAPADPPQLDFSKYKDLPKISDKDYGVRGSGGGSNNAHASGLYYWELENTSPWNGEELETMPVYMSCSTEEPDLDKMYARVIEVAAALGISEDELEITDTYYDVTGTLDKHREWGEEEGLSEEEIEEMLNRMFRSVMSMVQVTGKADGVEIRLNTAYSVYIYFDGLADLPAEYNFSDNATDEEKAEALNYLAKRYKELTGYSKPAQSRESYYDFVYDADGDLTEQIVNYWLNRTTFQFGRFNRDNSIWIDTDGALKKLADYPVLTAEQAVAILKSNRYSDDERMPADAKILKTELYYGNATGYTAVMPYYQFYIESDHNYFPSYDIECDVYTIAAVPEEFIDMDTKDYGVRA